VGCSTLEGGHRIETDLVKLLSEYAANGTPCVLATVVRCEAPTSARPGDKAVIAEDGTLTGWIGGSCSEPAVRREALRALADGLPRMLRISGSGKADEAGEPGSITMASTCPSGGSLDIFIDPHAPLPVLLAFGETPVAQTLARLAELVGFRARTVSHEELGSLTVRANDAWAVVTTMGHYDEDALAAALAHPALDVALVASRRRAGAILDALRERGLSEATLATVRTPAGGVQGIGQEEIALAALAEIVVLRRQRRQLVASPKLEEFATDPVCGMAVEIKRAAHTATYQDREYYFCCDGCRRQFLEDPARFAGAAHLAEPGRA
jgi:xanthine dehydrogenase accessory factor